jgi:exosortase E/protease (VPEID-CTERM system)
LTPVRSGSDETAVAPGLEPVTPKTTRLAEHAWLLPAGLLVLEVLALQARFSAAPFSDLDSGWGQVVRGMRELPRVGLLALTAVLVLGRQGLAQEWRALRESAVANAQRAAWVALQVGSFALLWALTTALLVRDPTKGAPPSLLLVCWPFLALVCVGLAVRATAPFGAWLGMLRRRSRLLGAAACVGALAWAAGTWSQDELREVLRLPTLRVAYALLYPFAEGAYIAPHAFQFGTAHFGVDLAPGCSGLDGIGLVGTFTAAWLVWQRKELRFPRALLLLPIGIAVSWLLNAARLAALVLIGEHGSGAAAVAGFHSVAGLVFFCATAIGVVVLGSSRPFQRSTVAERGQGLGASAAYLLPLVLWIGVGLLTTALPMEAGARLVLPGLVVLIVLFAGRRHLREWLQSPSWPGLAVTLACVVWSWVLPASVQADLMVREDLDGSVQGALGVLAALVVAPVVEELAFRGYLMRRFASPHFETVAPRAAGLIGIALSSILFGLLHPAWHAGIVFGLLYALAYVARGRLVDAVLAHAASNLAILICLR